MRTKKMDRLNVELYAPPHSSAIENRVDKSGVGCNQGDGEGVRVTRSCSSMGKSSREDVRNVVESKWRKHGKQENCQKHEK